VRFAGREEVADWLKAHGFVAGPDELAHDQPAVTFKIPVDAGRKTALARVLLGLLKDDQEAMLYIDEWGVFPSCEDTVLFDAFRRSLGTERPLIELPGQIFDANEFRYAQSLVGMVLYFFWGGLLVSGSGRLVVRVSHDEWLGLAGEPQDVDAAQASLKQFFEPRK